MKKLILIIFGLLILLAFNQNLMAQPGSYMINFEDTTSPYDLRIDTITNINNIWEIGEPNKVHFDSAYTKPNAIVTDLQNPYPINDTSSFIITHIAKGGLAYWPYAYVYLDFRYFVDSDTLLDYGMIEFSPDNGGVWVDLIDSTNYNISHIPFCPILTGSSNGWLGASINLTLLGGVYNVNYGDTTLFKFTFISDSIHSGKDGLMYDDIWIADASYIGIESYNDNTISVKTYPNPCQKELHIEYENKDCDTHSLYVFNTQGKMIKIIDKEKNNNLIMLNTCSYGAGIYYYLLINNQNNKKRKGNFIIN